MDSQERRLVAGRYQLVAPLGSGGMGTVWRAHDEVLGREVAVKEVTFPPGLSDGDRRVLYERTRREARAAAQLDHPSAVTVYDVVEDDGSPYLVMELVESRTLAHLIREDGPMSPQRTAEIGLALLGALEAAHRQGIVHRDVKPSNVLVREDGRVVLTDFGIATTTGDTSITHTGLLLGSPAYIAPERARGETPGPPSDLWSLGATLFTAVEGRPPFDGDEPLVVVTAVVTGEHSPYVAAGDLEPALEGLLAKDPTRRLDAAGVRPLLEKVATSAAGTAAAAATVVAPVADVRPTARTAALDLGDVQHEIAAAQPEAVPVPSPPERPAPSARETRPAPALARPQRTLPPPERDKGRPRWLVPVALAALLLLGTTAAAVAMTRGDDDPSGTTAAPSATPSPATPSPSASGPSPEDVATSAPAPPAPTSAAPPPADSSGAGAVPAGWSTDSGEAGWTVALPPGYAQSGPREYRQSSTGRTLRIETGPGQPDAVEDRRQQARSFASRHPSYEEIRIESVDYRGYEAADWEFTYEGLHVINRVFVVDGTGHSLFFQTSAGDFGEARDDFAGIAQAFQPVNG